MNLDAGLSEKIDKWFGEHNIHSAVILSRNKLHFYCAECSRTQDVEIEEKGINGNIVAVEKVSSK